MRWESLSAAREAVAAHRVGLGNRSFGFRTRMTFVCGGVCLVRACVCVSLCIRVCVPVSVAMAVAVAVFVCLFLCGGGGVGGGGG